ncbi:unnamed protein product [Mytilus coruscus]|uniref:Uncharacterized protein n=1 Tax=Mytilus coruscus TaxID=42192 RepID=A0A6J8CZI2_MYTCO|nr:unnamed protein product [Mytilus coruscus]
MQFLLQKHSEEIKEAIEKHFDKCNLTYSTEEVVVEMLSNENIIFSELTDILRNQAEELVIQIAPRTSRAKESLLCNLSAQVKDDLVHFFYDHEGRIHIVGFLEINSDINRAVDNVKLKYNMYNEADCEILLSGGLTKSTKKWSTYITNENTLYQNILQHLRHLEEQFKCRLSLEIQHPSIQYIAQCVNWDKSIHVVLVCGTAATLLADYVVCVSDPMGKYHLK